MLARQLFIVLVTLLTAPSVQGQQWVPNPPRDLVDAENVSEDITRLSVFEAGVDGVLTYDAVDLQGHVGTVGKLARMNIQVWLLRADGTTVAQRETLPCMDCLETIPPTDHRRFTFAAVPGKELAGVVVSVSGKLYVWEIKAS